MYPMIRTLAKAGSLADSSTSSAKSKDSQLSVLHLYLFGFLHVAPWLSIYNDPRGRASSVAASAGTGDRDPPELDKF